MKNVCMYICIKKMYVCKKKCMYVCMYEKNIYMYVCKIKCMYICM